MHQFVRIGRGAIIGGNLSVNDVIPSALYKAQEVL